MALNLDKTGNTPVADAINNYLSAGNHYIYFPEGLYYIDKQINLPSDTLIEAHPNAKFYDPNYRTTSKHRFFYSKDTVNVHIKGGYIVGNNANFAYETDGFNEMPDGFDQGCGVFFQNVNFGSVEHMKTCYLNESMVFKWCLETKVSHIRIDQGDQGGTQTGITLAGCENTHVSNARVTNGGDGALYIYNGFNCSIRDSVVENTGSHWNANSGMETCDYCHIDNVVVRGGAMGFPVVESARNCSVTNCKAENCTLGFVVGPFGIGTPGEDIRIINCSVIGVHKENDNITLPHAGFAICYYPVWGANSNRMSDSIQISNCYFGKSDAGHALHIMAGPNIDLSKVVITNNIFEGHRYCAANQHTYNSPEKLVLVDGANGALIANNIFTLPHNSQNPQIDIRNSQHIKFLNNTIITDAGNSQIGLNSSCNNCTIAGNTFRNCASGYTAVALNGTNNHVKDNIFSGAGQKITASGSNNYVLNNIAPNSTSSTFVSGSVAVKKGNYNNSGSEL